MSEKIYALLLRLYPSHFRATYGEEALQLFRDRARDETGFYLTVRLWLDLLTDLVFSLPREYGKVRRALFGLSAWQRLEGMPCFYVLDDESPRLGALLYGGILSLVIFGSIPVVIAHGGNYRAPEGWTGPPKHSITARRAKPHDAAGAMMPASDDGVKLDAAARQRLIEGVIVNLKEHYVDHDVAQKTADALLAHEKSGDNDGATESGALADLLTRQMREVSHDMHLVLIYSQTPLPDHPQGPNPKALARYRKELERQNCTFEKVEMLPHNIGYLKLNAFPDVSFCRSTAVAAMAKLNHADAVIFDLRDNRGGFASMVSLMASYLFDHPEYMYDPREIPTEQSWTQSPVPGNSLADKRIYVLTSSTTISAAEQFCYDLKMLRRATFIGETTRGSAHSGVFHRLNDHFGMGIPEVRAINPFSKNDWEGTGVEPDVKVQAADALKTAEKLAASRLQK